MTAMPNFADGQWSRRKKLIGAAAAAVATAALGFVVPQVLGAIKTKVVPGPALHAQVITDVARFRSSAPHVPEFVIPRPLAQIGRPPDASDIDPQFPQQLAMRAAPLRYAWAHHQGGVDATETLLRISISGSSGAATDLQQLRVRLVRCQPPLKGQLVSYLGLGSGIGARYFSIDLDSNAPVAEYVDAKGRAKKEQPFPLRVTDSDQEVFDVSAGITRHDCEWTLLLDWTAGARHGTTVIDDHGKPFRTTSGGTADGAVPGITTATWDPVSGRWVTSPH
jgi:hypothetical protein